MSTVSLYKVSKNLYFKIVLPCLLFVMKPIFATSGFPTPGWVTAIGAVFVIVVMVAAAGAGIIREVMTHLLIIDRLGKRPHSRLPSGNQVMRLIWWKWQQNMLRQQIYSSLFFTNFTKSLLLNGYGQFFYSFIKGNRFCQWCFGTFSSHI